MTKTYKIAFGDIHNHNAHGYGKGSIERSLDIARSHLDFYAFTGHASWHDLNPERDARLAHFSKGFERLKQTWPRVQEAIAQANEPGIFAAFLGFEWHSNYYGDQCVIFPDDYKDICYAEDLDGLRSFCRENNAMLLPHHVAYPKGVRGLNWDYYDPDLAPVVEIYSMHGCSETDRSPYPMRMGSPGGRSTEQTIAAALARGQRFGFTASTDSHIGFPGAWGEGVTGALVTDVTRDGVMEAIRARRTYALTGDRIYLDFKVNGALMGSEIACDDELEIEYDIDCRDEIDRVEVIMNNQVVDTAGPAPAGGGGQAPATYQLRFEWGWGPWGSLDTPKTVDWSFNLNAKNARISRVFPCWTSGPFDENRRHKIASDADHVSVSSYTSRQDSFNGMPNQAIVIEFEGTSDTRFDLDLKTPASIKRSFDFSDLMRRSFEFHVGGYPSESVQIQRLSSANETRLQRKIVLPVPPESSFVYLRVTQKNGQMAWSSPVFVN